SVFKRYFTGARFRPDLIFLTHSLWCFAVLGGLLGELKEEPDYTSLTPAYHPTFCRLDSLPDSLTRLPVHEVPSENKELPADLDDRNPIFFNDPSKMPR